MGKMKVGHIAVGCVIFRATRPGDIFILVKDATYPHRVWRGCVCLVGGNWMEIGGQRSDLKPLATLRREVFEELSLTKPPQNTDELGETSNVGDSIEYCIKSSNRPVTPQDVAELEIIKMAIVLNARPFDDYIVTIPREVFLRGDSESGQEDMRILFCAFEASLTEDVWNILLRLERDFGNICCESESWIVSAEELAKRQIPAIAGHDVVLRQFFESRGVHAGIAIPVDEMVGVERAPVHPLFSYEDYMRHYEVVK